MTHLAADALLALRQNPLRSLLSILGLVIGIAALVAILALGDGLEQYARSQIGATTSVQGIVVSPRTVDRIDGIMVRRNAIALPTPDDAAALRLHLDGSAAVAVVQERGVRISHDTVVTAVSLFAADAGIWSLRATALAGGRLFTDDDRGGVVLTHALAERLGAAPGETIVMEGSGVEVIGVLAPDARPAEAYGAWGAFASDLGQRPPNLLLRATRAEEVAQVAAATEAWLDRRYPGGSDAFTLVTDRQRAAQVRQGMTLFKLVFGLITGLSVIVGGVGVMNVLLVTVTERTREIGIRKAVGARRRDILMQFLAEAMTVSCAGSVIGAVTGLAGVFLLLPVIRAITEVEFHAAITAPTLLVVAGVALAVGLAFGTYPAVRAARLSPVEAMRRE